MKVTNFSVNSPLNYNYLNAINAINMCYYQNYFMDNNNIINTSPTSYQKETSLKEIYEINKSYPFVHKNKDKDKMEENNNIIIKNSADKI